MLVHLAEAPINLRNFYGETALHLAVEGGFTDIVEVKFESNSIFCFDGVASPGKCNFRGCWRNERSETNDKFIGDYR